MYTNSPPSPSNNKKLSEDNKSIMLTCNLDSVDSMGEFMKRVYNTIIPRCSEFKAKIRRYGDKKNNNVVHFITIPKTLVNLIMTDYEQKELELKKDFDIRYYYDRNMFRKVDRETGREELYILMKMVKKP